MKVAGAASRDLRPRRTLHTLLSQTLRDWSQRAVNTDRAKSHRLWSHKSRPQPRGRDTYKLTSPGRFFQGTVPKIVQPAPSRPRSKTLPHSMTSSARASPEVLRRRCHPPAEPQHINGGGGVRFGSTAPVVHGGNSVSIAPANRPPAMSNRSSLQCHQRSSARRLRKGRKRTLSSRSLPATATARNAPIPPFSVLVEIG